MPGGTCEGPEGRTGVSPREPLCHRCVVGACDFVSSLPASESRACSAASCRERYAGAQCNKTCLPASIPALLRAQADIRSSSSKGIAAIAILMS